MTYQNLGYWVAQANDSSTGNHPTGWTIYQRWSETASEWATMYNTEYANARDNSAGQPNKPSGTAHPTGWASGQFWSATATQWNTMWGTEWTNARDNSAGQTSSGLGAAHPTGWAASQQWSTTAEQWNSMWGTEWRNSHDPQGYPFSYPGQPANNVFWSQTAQYWKGQADYYWGPNGLWNSGTTWKALYEAYVGYYNDMVNQRDAWISYAHSDPNVWTNRYNTGWTDGRATKTTQTVQNGTWTTFTSNNFDWSDVNCYITAPRSGQCQVTAIAILNGGGGDPHGLIRILANGGVVAQSNQGNTGTGGNGTLAALWYGVVGGGTVFNVQSKGWCTFSNNNASINSGYMTLTVGDQ